MNRAVVVLFGTSLLLVTLPVATAAPGDVLYETHVDAAPPMAGTVYGAMSAASPRGLGLDPIERASPWTHFVDVTGRAGAWVTTVADDGTGLGVWVETGFRNDAMHLDATCVDPTDEQGYLSGDLGVVHVSDICQVPAAATTLMLRVEQAADVDLQVVEVDDPAADPSAPVVGVGHIAAAPLLLGTTWTYGFGYSGHYGLAPYYPDSLPSEHTAFAFHLPTEGRDRQELHLEVKDAGGIGFVVRMQFYDDMQRFRAASCVTMNDGQVALDAPETFIRQSQRCSVPGGATHMVVYADHGRDLHVTVRSDVGA